MKKRTTDLFRFATLRTPQLITQDRRKLGFIEHPDHSESFFLSLILQTDSLEEARAKLLAEAATFVPYSSVESIKNLSLEFWEFSIWLASNKDNLVRSELDALMPTNNLSESDIFTLWDNVHYDVITEQNPYLRQASLQLIVAANFMSNYQLYSPGITTDEQEIEMERALLKRLADGKVVIQDAFTSLKVSTLDFSASYATYSSKKQEQIHLGFMATIRIAFLERAKRELCKLQNLHSNAYKTAYDAAQNAHTILVKSEVEAYISENPEIAGAKEIESLIPEGVVTAFNFSFIDALSSDYTEGKLSEDVIQYIADLCMSELTIESVVAALCTELHEKKKVASRINQKKIGVASVNGVTIRPNSSANKDYALSFEKFVDDRGDQMADIYLSLNVGYDSSVFTGGSFSFKIGGVSSPITSPAILSTKNNSVFLKLNNSPISFPQNSSFELSASFQLNNGSKYLVEKKGGTSETIISGIAVFIQSGSEETPIYGVNRIGIADYRRVEQELCCYIPGEVSHIENILAKEYKERNTRNFISTESSFESTSEREMEQSTDTSSTSRFEMSSEISEVLQQDRNANTGFDFGTQGKLFKNEFTFNAFGDFSLGQSSTNSNSIARNYAEDVTRRALERIVQKTTTRRSSKILREFEDTNKHGYDNREGDKHVTGVFRWIDKVYKNRIINYQKRLMYEFMLPEPARFYKDAILLQAEEEDVNVNLLSNDVSVIVKPINPSEHGITGADSIKRTNYKQFASLYGVNPAAPEDELVSVHGSFSESIGNGDAAHSFNGYSPIIIPVEYECIAITGTVQYNKRAYVPQWGHINVSTGGKLLSVTNLTGSGNGSKPINFTGLSIQNSVQVSVETKKVTSFSLSIDVNCRLKNSSFSQWQQDVYSEIQTAYEQQLQAYNDAMSVEQANAETSQGVQAPTTLEINPRFNAKVVQNELKRLCIEMLTKPFGRQQGKDFYQVGPCEVPELKLNSQLDSYGSQVKFFEQAFDWEILSQLFYPYYWAKKCDWKALFQSQSSNDPIFQAFLQSGMGRVIVPVRVGFEDAVTFYMETGKIWNGSPMVVETDDELYLSIVDEMTLLDNSIEKTEWETIVPSELTIVQAKSVLLEEEGLPCCETDSEVLALLTLKADDTILIGKSENV